MKKVLLTGRITDLPILEVKDNFNKVFDVLKEKGYVIVLPDTLHNPTNTNDISIRRDIMHMADCHELHLLSNWQECPNSILLRDIAIRLGSIEIVYH